MLTSPSSARQHSTDHPPRCLESTNTNALCRFLFIHLDKKCIKVWQFTILLVVAIQRRKFPSNMLPLVFTTTTTGHDERCPIIGLGVDLGTGTDHQNDWDDLFDIVQQHSVPIQLVPRWRC